MLPEIARRVLGPIKLDADEHSIWRRFRRNFSVSLAGTVVSLAIKSGQTLLLVRILPMGDYGRVLIVLNLFGFLSSFVGVRVSDVMFRFFERLRHDQDDRALQGLLLFCLAISITTSSLIVFGVFLFSPWLSESLYHNRELAPLFNIYGGTVLLSSLSDVFGPVLRIYDRFPTLIVPQVLGNLVTALTLTTLVATNHRDLKLIVAAFTIGVVVQNVPPLVQALRLVKPYLADIQIRVAASALARYRSELARCLFNSNVSGYLKIAASPGDVLLLGIFSSPAQVALYGLAKQLIAPLALLQTNVQVAITPEITSLIARQKLRQFTRLARRYVASAFILGAALTVGALLLGRVVVLKFSQPDYAAALPVFYILLFGAWVLLICAALRPLALSLDLLRWDNLSQLLVTFLLAGLIIVHRLDAISMAVVQLAGVLVLRLLCNLPVWVRLRELSLERRASLNLLAGKIESG